MIDGTHNHDTAFSPPSWNWRECQDSSDLWRRTPPLQPARGQGWLDERSHCLYIWDGAEWVCVPTD